jgi:hypothetical protein
MADYYHEQVALSYALIVEILDLEIGAVKIFHADAVVTDALNRPERGLAAHFEVAAG